MNSPMFFIWLVVAMTQIALFTRFILKKNSVEESIDIVPVLIYNNNAYWKQDNILVYANYANGEIDKKYKKVDQKNFSEVSPLEVIYILEELEG